MVTLVKAKQAQVVGIIPNMAHNLIMRTDFPFAESWTRRKRVKKEAKIVGITTIAQLKMRMQLKWEGKEPGILPNNLD